MLPHQLALLRVKSTLTITYYEYSLSSTSSTFLFATVDVLIIGYIRLHITQFHPRAPPQHSHAATHTPAVMPKEAWCLSARRRSEYAPEDEFVKF